MREIAARATTLVTDENVAIIVPNSHFIAEPVTNWSRPNVLTGYVLTFHVAPASDPDLVRGVLLAAAAAHPDVRGEPAAEVEFVEIGPASLSFKLQVWSNAHLKTAGKLKSDLNFDGLEAPEGGGCCTADRGDCGHHGVKCAVTS